MLKEKFSATKKTSWLLSKCVGHSDNPIWCLFWWDWPSPAWLVSLGLFSLCDLTFPLILWFNMVICPEWLCRPSRTELMLKLQIPPGLMREGTFSCQITALKLWPGSPLLYNFPSTSSCDALLGYGMFCCFCPVEFKCILFSSQEGYFIGVKAITLESLYILPFSKNQSLVPKHLHSQSFRAGSGRGRGSPWDSWEKTAPAPARLRYWPETSGYSMLRAAPPPGFSWYLWIFLFFYFTLKTFKLFYKVKF